MRGTVHPRFASLLFGALLSIIMVSIVSAAVIVVNQGFTADFIARWMKSTASTWPIAFPAVLMVAPVVRRMVSYLTTPQSDSA